MNPSAAERELLALEREYWQAIKDKDANTAMRLSDNPCIVTGAQGVGRIDNQTLAEMLKNPPYTLHAFTISEDAHVRLLGDDVAVLAYNVHEELTVDGQPVSLDAAEASTWVRRSGRWSARCIPSRSAEIRSAAIGAPIPDPCQSLVPNP